MARIKGAGIKPEGRYVARPAMAQGLYWVSEEPQALEEDAAQTIRVALPVDLVRRLVRWRQPGETLAGQVRRLLETHL